MKPQTTTKGAAARFWRLHLVAAMLLLTLVSTAFAAPGTSKHGPKAAPDLDNFPVNPDGTVSVIVQLSPGTPPGQVKKFARAINRNLTGIGAVAANIPVSLLDKFLSNGWVTYVSPDRPNKPMWDDAPPPVNAGVARQNYGVDGTGIGIAVIDSGMFAHDDLMTADGTASRIVYSESFVPGDSSTNDAYGHGTHVAGILAGNGRDSGSGSGYSNQYVGIAPNASIINLRVLDGNGGGSDSVVIAAINRAIQLKAQYNIRVINLSLGRNVYESYTLDPLCQAVEAAWQSGIVVVVAAGNLGRDNSWGEQGYATVQAPGNDPNVITVGAMNPLGTWTRTDDVVASYSSKGPTLLDHIVKPDIMAPGNQITSLLAPGSKLAGLAPTSALISSTPTTICNVALGVTTCSAAPVATQYLQLSGTSMATPVVSAAAALLVQKDPTLTPDTIKARMMRDAWKGYPARGKSWSHDIKNNAYMAQYDVFTIGSGYLDIQATLGDSTVVNGGAASPAVVFDPTTGNAKLVNGTSVVWGQSMVWGQSSIWANSVVWGQLTVDDATSVVWGNSVVWGQTSDAACSMVWGQSVVWGQLTDALNALSESDPGDTNDTTPPVGGVL